VRRKKEEKGRRVTLKETQVSGDGLLKTRRRYEVTLVAGDGLEV
jgi:hypothetical protein